MGSISPRTPFGKPMREHFLFDKNFRNFNHGSFGTYPHPVRSALHNFQSLSEARPDTFIRYESPTHLYASRLALATLLDVPLDTCVFVQNATLGINTILRNLVYEPGDVIVYFDTIYGACEKTIASILETNSNVSAKKVAGYDFPCEHGEIVERFVEAVRGLQKDGLKAKVAVFDTICAMPGVRFPFERLTEECRRLGILSCIDGAHGIGQIPLDLGKLDPDFFVSNCHKWLFLPRGCALLHITRRNHPQIRTTYPTSHGFTPLATSPLATSHILNPLPPQHPSTASPFTNLFDFVATMDNSPYYCVPAALKFRAEICGGEESVMAYLRESIREGGDRVAAMLGTDVMANQADREGGRGGGGRLRDCAFANVRLPITVTEAARGSGSGSGSGAVVRGGVTPREIPAVVAYMQQTFVQEFNTFIVVYGYQGRLWTRLSGQIYLEEGDWEWCGNVLGEVCARVREGRFREAAVEAAEGEGERDGEDEKDANGVEDLRGNLEEFSVEQA